MPFNTMFDFLPGLMKVLILGAISVYLILTIINFIKL